MIRQRPFTIPFTIRLKAAVTAGLTALISLSTSAASAYSQDEYENSVSNLEQQSERLASQSNVRCSADYKDIYAGKTLKIGLFYGYEDFDEVTTDSLHAKSMLHALTRSCKGNMGACGFKKIESSPNITRVSKVIHGKQVVISVYSTSLTDDNNHNMDPNSGYWDQDKMSRHIKAEFHRELQQSDVVFYSGHSRHGSGFGFDPQSLAQHAVNYLFKTPLQETLEVLSQRPTRLKLLGVMSCTSDEFYRGPIEAANPDLALALTSVDLEADNGEQISLGLLNSILTQKCSRELQQSIHAEIEPSQDALHFTKHL